MVRLMVNQRIIFAECSGNRLVRPEPIDPNAAFVVKNCPADGLDALPGLWGGLVRFKRSKRSKQAFVAAHYSWKPIQMLKIQIQIGV